MKSRCVYLLCLPVFFFAACRKKSPDPIIKPPVLENATVTILEPKDSMYFPQKETIIIRAKVEGTIDEDYSFLDAYVIDQIDDPSTTTDPIVRTDTLQKTKVAADGGIEAVLNDTLEAGLHRMWIVVQNPDNSDQKATSLPLSLYIGLPPAVQITSLEKDDVSNTVYWSRSPLSNFEAYEVYVTRTDTMRDRPPYPEGQLVARITNRDSLSFRHDSIYFFYKYNYLVKVVTDEDYSNNSERKEIVAGSFIQLEERYRTDKSIHDQKREKIYLFGDPLKIVNPATLEIEDSIDLPETVVLMKMNRSGNSLDCIFLYEAGYDTSRYQLASIDLDTRQVTLQEQFSLARAYTVFEVYMNKTLICKTSTPTIPQKSQVIAYNITNGQTEMLREGYFADFREISNDRLIIGNGSDSFFVFKQTAGIFSLVTAEYALNYSNGGFLGAHESLNFITIGRLLFDQLFTLVHELPGEAGDNRNFFTGLSNDGNYVVTRHNEIINTSTMQVVRKYGDGFGTVVYFSSDNNILYHFTEGALNPKWNPEPRLFRYPWR